MAAPGIPLVWHPATAVATSIARDRRPTGNGLEGAALAAAPQKGQASPARTWRLQSWQGTSVIGGSDVNRTPAGAVRATSASVHDVAGEARLTSGE